MMLNLNYFAAINYSIHLIILQLFNVFLLLFNNKCFFFGKLLNFSKTDICAFFLIISKINVGECHLKYTTPESPGN